MIPKKVAPFFKRKTLKKSNFDELISGEIECCNQHSFKIRIYGKIEKSLLGGTYLMPKNNNVMVLNAICNSCNKNIAVFNSVTDGYYNCVDSNNSILKENGQEYECQKCNSKDFSIRVKYEYPCQEELNELEISNQDTAFTWIVITLKCNKCGKIYRGFVDYDAS